MTNYEKVVCILLGFGLSGLIGMVAMSVGVDAPMVWGIYVAIVVGIILGYIIGKD